MRRLVFQSLRTRLILACIALLFCGQCAGIPHFRKRSCGGKFFAASSREHHHCFWLDCFWKSYLHNILLAGYDAATGLRCFFKPISSNLQNLFNCDELRESNQTRFCVSQVYAGTYALCRRPHRKKVDLHSTHYREYA